MRRNNCRDCVENEDGRCLQLNVILSLNDYTSARHCPFYKPAPKTLIYVSKGVDYEPNYHGA